MFKFAEEVTSIWISGGWLMLPLFVLTIFIYYTAIELLISLNTHFLIRSGVHHFEDSKIKVQLDGDLVWYKSILLTQSKSVVEVRKHFQEVYNEYIPVVNRRIRFLGIVITASPLVGLLGTVTGMLSTFAGMTEGQDTKFDSIVSGISQALITTQAGLIVAIPAFVILSFIIQRRNTLVRCIQRLEQYNVQEVLRSCKENALNSEGRIA